MNIVFPELPIDVIGQLCSIHTKFNNVCQNENLWIIKTTHDYPIFVNQKPNTSTWRDFYIYLFNNFKNVQVIYNSQVIGNIWISRLDNWDEFKNKIRPLIQSPKIFTFLDINNNIISSDLDFSQVWSMISSILITDIDITRVQPMRAAGRYYTIGELRQILTSLGLPVTGNKLTLVNRIEHRLI